MRYRVRVMRNEVAVGRKLHCERAITKKKVALVQYKDANVRYYGSPFPTQD